LTRSDFNIGQIYYPYWKIEAIRLNLQKYKTVKRQQVDYNSFDTAFYGMGPKVTQAASSMEVEETKIKVNLSPFSATQSAGPCISGLPASLGLRTEYIKALPFSSELADTDCEYYPVTVTWEEVKSNITKSMAIRAKLNLVPGGKAHSELFNISGSLVYFPYILAISDTASDFDYFIVDGLSGRVVHAGPIPESPFGNSSASGSLLDFAQLKVEFHRCFNCGIDLPASRSAVYICHNCHSVVSLDTNQKLIEGMQEVSIGSECEDQMFPFWSFAADPNCVKGLVKPVTDCDKYDRLLVPAFRVSNFEALHRLCQRITGGATQLSLQTVEHHDKRFKAIDIGLREALTLGEIILYREAIAQNPAVTSDAIKLNPSQSGIIFVPFHPRNYFYVDSLNGNITFEKSIVDR
jgi:hypothetical protein